MRHTASEALLSFYQCITDPEHFAQLVEILGSWIGEDDEEVVTLLLEEHSERVWSILASYAEQHKPSENPHEQEIFATHHALSQALEDRLNANDAARFTAWLSQEAATSTPDAPGLLIQLFDQHNPETSPQAALLRTKGKNGLVLSQVSPDFETYIANFIAESFSLSHAETYLLRGLVQGGTLRSIAQDTGKSMETLRSQIKSISNKLDVNSQAEIQRLASHTATMLSGTTASQQTATNPIMRSDVKILARPDGRKIAYTVHGKQGARALVYVHGTMDGRHWPKSCIDRICAQNWKLILISRAGYGKSSINAKSGLTLLADHSADMLAVLQAENLKHCALLANTFGISIAYRFALAFPELVTRVVCVNPMPPLLSRKDTKKLLGAYKVGALVALFAPATLKVLVKTGIRGSNARIAKGSSQNIVESDYYPEDHMDEEGLATIYDNYLDLIAHSGEGAWRDMSYWTEDWAAAAEHANHRPETMFIETLDCQFASPDMILPFAKRIQAQVTRGGASASHITGILPEAIELLA